MLLISKSLSTQTVRPEALGVPQGLSISNILANIYLEEIDRTFNDVFRYYRYVDDILVVCKSKEHASEVFQQIRSALARERKLICHELGDSSKTCIKSVDDGVDYLGFHLAREKVSVRESSFRKMIGGLASLMVQLKDMKSEARFLWRLNIRITGCVFEGKNYGWMFFFLPMNDVGQLARLDRFIKTQLKKRGRGDLVARVKTFVKSYHEIRFNRKGSAYIPNFDTIDPSEMANILSTLTGKPIKDVVARGEEVVLREFKRLVKKEVSLLEKDILESFS